MIRFTATRWRAGARDHGAASSQNSRVFDKGGIGVFFFRSEPDDVETAGLERLTICFVLFASALKIRRAQVNSC